MALSSRKSKRKTRHTTKLEERIRQLAPIQREGAVRASADDGDADEGILRTSLERLPLASGFVEEERNAPWRQPRPVLLVVLGLALAFIAFLTWEIATRSRWVEDEGWKIETKQTP